jgi:hypothetical protein
VLKATNGISIFTDETKASFEQEMLSAYPGYGCSFMVALL